MKKILFILCFAPFLLAGQSLNLSNGDFRFSPKIYVAETDHLFAAFGDSTITFTFATQDVWYQVTNASDSLFGYMETDGFTVLGDTITVVRTAHYDMDCHLTLDGGNGETISMRFYNVTQTAGIPTANAHTFGGSANYESIDVDTYSELTAGDKIIIQLKNGDVSPANSIIKNGKIEILYVHD